MPLPLLHHFASPLLRHCFTTASVSASLSCSVHVISPPTDPPPRPTYATPTQIPPGISVRHGSNQSVIEFYGEYYSNTDLQAFMALSGLANVSLPQVDWAPLQALAPLLSLVAGVFLMLAPLDANHCTTFSRILSMCRRCPSSSATTATTNPGPAARGSWTSNT